MIYLLLSLNFAGAEGGVKPEQMSLIMDTEDKYQKAEGISMDVERTDKTEALDLSRKFAGTLKIKKGKFRLEVESQDSSKDKSLVVADGKTLWLVTFPPTGFKDVKTQVASISMSNKQIFSKSFLPILTEGGLLKHFKVKGVLEAGDETTFLLEPKATNKDFKRAQLTVKKKDHSISGLKYWDASDNQTIFQFSKVDFKKPIDDSLLSYTPPKDADVTKL
jgi:outer membrane lipoprotein-sorting protein